MPLVRQNWRTLARSAATAVVSVPFLRALLRAAAVRGRLPRAVWQRLPVTQARFTVRTSSANFEYAVVPGDHLARALYWRGVHGQESETLEVFQPIAARSTTVVDVGANTGIYSLVACAASPDVRVEAFEAVPRVQAALQHNIDLNGWSDRCRVHDVAVTDKAGEVEFVVPCVAMPTSAHLASAIYRSNTGGQIRVRGARLDDMLSTPVDLVKIDVEGAEDTVLAGMTRILRDDQPWLVVECLPEGPYVEVQRILDSFGYRYEHLTARGRMPVSQIRPDVHRRERNFLCIPPGRG